MSIGKRLASVATTALLLAAATACSGIDAVPAAGTSSLTERSSSTGQDDSGPYLASLGAAYPDEALARYVNQVGQRVVAASDIPDADITFTVVDNPTYNAVVTPAGQVFVLRGLLALIDDEAELAAVLAHEVGHVAAGHAADRAQRREAALTRGEAYVGSSYSFAQEFEADGLAVRYLARTDYDPGAVASEIVAKRQRERDVQALADNDDPAPSVTHPPNAARIEQAQAAIRTVRARGTERYRERYLQAVDGMRYGPNPQRGYVQDRMIVNPEYGFAFEAPEGFTLAHHLAQVQGEDADGRRLFFSVVDNPAGLTGRAYISRVWVKGVDLGEIEDLTIEGAQAARVRVRSNVGVDRRGADADLYVIEGDGYLFRFAFVDGRRYIDERTAERFEDSVRSFRIGAPSARGAAGEGYIYVHTVAPGQTRAGLAKRMPVREQDILFAWLNRLGPGDEVRPGQKVKMVLVRQAGEV